MRQEHLFNLEANIHVGEQLGVRRRRSQSFGCRFTNLGQVCLPKGDNLINLGWQIRSRKQSRLGKTLGAHQNLRTLFNIASQQVRHKSNVRFSVSRGSYRQSLHTRQVADRRVQHQQIRIVVTRQCSRFTQLKVGFLQSSIRKSLPLGLCLCRVLILFRRLFKQLMRDVDLTKLQSQLKLVIGISRHSKGLFLEPL